MIDMGPKISQRTLLRHYDSKQLGDLITRAGSHYIWDREHGYVQKAGAKIDLNKLVNIILCKLEERSTTTDVKFDVYGNGNAFLAPNNKTETCGWWIFKYTNTLYEKINNLQLLVISDIFIKPEEFSVDHTFAYDGDGEGCFWKCSPVYSGMNIIFSNRLDPEPDAIFPILSSSEDSCGDWLLSDDNKLYFQQK